MRAFDQHSLVSGKRLQREPSAAPSAQADAGVRMGAGWPRPLTLVRAPAVMARCKDLVAFVTGNADPFAGMCCRQDPVAIHRAGRAACRAPVNVTGWCFENEGHRLITPSKRMITRPVRWPPPSSEGFRHSRSGR